MLCQSTLYPRLVYIILIRIEAAEIYPDVVNPSPDALILLFAFAMIILIDIKIYFYRTYFFPQFKCNRKAKGCEEVFERVFFSVNFADVYQIFKQTHSRSAYFVSSFLHELMSICYRF